MSVMGLLMPVAGLIKARYRGAKAEIESPFFKLHYRTTTTICFICCILVTCNDLIGNTISCINDSVPGNVLNSYCWIMSTFSIPSQNKGVDGVNRPHQGVGPETEDENDRKVHAYYQWVPFMLFLQGVMFYIPHYLWKTFEDKKMNKITSGLRGKNFSADGKREQCENLINYLWETRGMHNAYAFKYFFCDLLNLVNIFGQMYFVNMFLGGVFMTYGTDVLNFMNQEDEDRSDPMMEVFPRVTKCTFHKYGSSGTIMKLDALCVLGLNIINEKIYITLWFWFVFLALATSLYTVYVVAIISMPGLRRNLVIRKAIGSNKDLARHLVEKANIGDWFLIFLISRNLDSIMYNIFIQEISEKFKTKA